MPGQTVCAKLGGRAPLWDSLPLCTQQTPGGVAEKERTWRRLRCPPRERAQVGPGDLWEGSLVCVRVPVGRRGWDGLPGGAKLRAGAD